MNELIKVSYESDRPTVLGRELYEFLGVQTPYKKWFGRMCEYGFTDGIDYSEVSDKIVQNPQGGRPATDHQLTIPMAKELCMLQRTDKGKEARQYFIAVEEAWNSPDAIMRRALMIANPTSEMRAKAMALNAKTRAAKQLMALWDKAGVAPAYQALALGDYYREDGIKLPAIALQQSTKVTYDRTTIAEKLGILSNSGKPHALAVGAIIGKLGIGEDEREAVPYSRHGHDGVDYQYTESVIDKIDQWIAINDNPAQIIGANGKRYTVRYV